MSDSVTDLLSDGLSSPLGEVIASVGRGVAEAQAALDAASIKTTMDIYSSDDDTALRLLREIGYQPTFYVLPETTCEVQVSMRISGTGSGDPQAARARTYVTPVDAGFQQRYGFLAQGAAKLTFKIVPVPPPSALDGARPMPDLVGLKATDAASLLQRLGLSAQLVGPRGGSYEPADAAVGDKYVVAQDAPQGSLQAVASVVTLTIAARP